MVRLTTKTWVALTVAFAGELAARDTEIERHHSDIEDLTQTNSLLREQNAEKDFNAGELNGEVTALTERLQYSEDGNKDAFNEVQRLTALVATLRADNAAVMQKESEMSYELESLKEGKPVQTANPENLRSLMRAMLTGDTDRVGQAVHKLLDIPFTEAILFAQQTVGDTKLSILDAEGSSPVVEALFNDDESDDASGVVSSIDPSSAQQAEQAETAAVVEAQVG